MASIRERIDANGKKSYHVQVRLQGFPPQTKSFDSKTLAKQWAQHVEGELRAGRYMPHARAQKRTVKDLLEEYRTRVLIPLKPKRVRDQGPQLDWWIEKLGHYSLADITPAIIGRARDDLLTTPIPSKAKPDSTPKKTTADGEDAAKEPRMRAPATVLRYMALLSHSFNVAVKEWEWLPASPMARVKKPKVSNARVRYLNADELDRLRVAAVQSANRFLAPAIEMAVCTGMRQGELMNLRWRDIQFTADDQGALVLLEQTKNGDRRGVPLTGSGLAAVLTLRAEHARTHGGKVDSATLLFPGLTKPDKPTKPIELRSAWHTALKAANIENFRWHDLRHTTASFMAMEGATAPEIAEVLGHRDLQMVKRYAHLSKAHISKVLERMTDARLAPAAKTEEAKDGQA